VFGVPTRRIRIVVQGAIFALWVALIMATHYPMQSWLARHIPVSLFLRIDPLVMTVVCGGMRVGVTLTLLGAVTLMVSLLLGRVFCGWVCPARDDLRFLRLVPKATQCSHRRAVPKMVHI